MTEIESRSPIIIGLYKPDREVYWWVDGYEHDEKYVRLFSRMEDYLVNGNTLTILEYHPNGWNADYGDIGKRAEWWDERLREQGYDIYDPDEEYDDDIEGN